MMLTRARQIPAERVLTEVLRWLPLAAVMLWVYGPVFPRLLHQWLELPDCGHCFLAPLYSGFLLWHRRSMLRTITVRGSWWGVAFLALAALMQWVSAYRLMDSLHRFSLLPCIAGIVLFVWGWQTLRWAGPSIAFLLFMYPLTPLVFDRLSLPLQQMATTVSAFILQVVGIPAFGEGTVLVLRNCDFGIEAACCGLRATMFCLAICTGAVFVMQRNLLDKVVIVVSSVPIAILVNVVRITATGIAGELGGRNFGNWFHDNSRALVVPIVIVLLWIETWLMSLVWRTSRRRRQVDRA
jgi:exosortase